MRACSFRYGQPVRWTCVVRHHGTRSVDLKVNVKVATLSVKVKVTHVVGQGRSRVAVTSHVIFHVMPLCQRCIRHLVTSLPLRRSTSNHFRLSDTVAAHMTSLMTSLMTSEIPRESIVDCLLRTWVKWHGLLTRMLFIPRRPRV